MTTDRKPIKLYNENYHPRDAQISFEEGPHIYTVMGERGTYTSVTTWVHKNFPAFDSNAIIDKMLSSPKMTDPKYKYFGMTKEQILEQWNTKRDSSASAGTNMHFDIECYFNDLKVENESIEFEYFLRFVKDFPHLKPYRTEWMVYYEEMKLSGSIDMIFENPDGTLEIYDWKRCQEIAYETGFDQYAKTPCINHLPDTNFWHYSLQLNIYKKILEDKYGKKVVGLYLVCLHPDNSGKTYDRIEVPVLKQEMEDLFNERYALLTVSGGRNRKPPSPPSHHRSSPTPSPSPSPSPSLPPTPKAVEVKSSAKITEFFQPTPHVISVTQEKPPPKECETPSSPAPSPSQPPTENIPPSPKEYPPTKIRKSVRKRKTPEKWGC